MRKQFIRIVSVLMAVAVFASMMIINSSADSASQLQNDIAALKQQSQELQAQINSLKSKKADQQSILNAIKSKIANTQAQISRCNQEISNINAKISENNAEIEKRNAEIENEKLNFKKRIRAIYMSNTNSNVQILMGAESFADFLQLQQLTESVSSRDKALIESIIAEVEKLNAIKAENEKLLASQVEVKNSVLEAQKALKAEEDEAQSIYNGIAATQNEAQGDKNDLDAVIKEKQSALNKILGGGGSFSFVSPNTGFIWPTPGIGNITSYYGMRWGRLHAGVDISDGSIGKPIVAIADGYVYEVYTACPHRDKASRCRCGSGWGNHVAVNHGTVLGSNFKAMYAHMDRVAVSYGQYVKQGQTIGYVGTTGDSTGYHLHFGLMKDGGWVDPMVYYRKVS